MRFLTVHKKMVRHHYFGRKVRASDFCHESLGVVCALRRKARMGFHGFDSSWMLQPLKAAARGDAENFNRGIFTSIEEIVIHAGYCSSRIISLRRWSPGL
jgi:hypothetical protein